MKNLLLFVFLWTLGNTFAQPGPPDEKKREAIEAEKIAFISRELSLTPEEAEKFWPVYNEYSDKLMEIRKERHENLKKLHKVEKLTDEEAYETTQKVFQLEKEESDVRIEYLAKFAEILGKKKATQVFIAEEKFKRELLRRLKEDKQGHGTPPPR